MNTFIYINNHRKPVNVPNGYETLFKGIRFKDAEEFEQCRELASRANACFDNCILFMNIEDLNRSKEYLEQLFQSIHIKELERFEDYDPEQDISNYETCSY
jgi:hypothetical protein